MAARKAWIANSMFVAVALLFLLSAIYAMSAEASARTEARYLMKAGDAYFGNDLYSSRSIQTLFHQQTLDVSDLEHYQMSFPPFDGGLALGPSTFNNGFVGNDVDAAGIATANVLPFGPVNLAFPSIHEDVTQTVLATRTGFFASNYNYRPEADFGNVPLTTGYPYALRQAICPAPLFGGASLYPEQFDTWWANNRLKEIGAAAQAANPPANQTTPNQTTSNQTALNQPAVNQTTSIRAPAMIGLDNSTIREQVKASDLKPPLAIEYFKPKNASTKPWDMPVVYPSMFSLAGKGNPVFPNPGIGTFSTNGAGSTGASLTGPLPTATPAAAVGGRTISNQTMSDLTASNQTTGNRTTSNQTAPAAPATGTIVTPPWGNGLTYADFNFDATTQQINQMPLLARMWRNSHRGGQMGKAYLGDTSMPNWIDPYDRPYDLSMLDEHFYVLQSALNMVVPGTQIMPRFWSLGLV